MLRWFFNWVNNIIIITHQHHSTFIYFSHVQMALIVILVKSIAIYSINTYIQGEFCHLACHYKCFAGRLLSIVHQRMAFWAVTVVSPHNARCIGGTSFISTLCSSLSQGENWKPQFSVLGPRTIHFFLPLFFWLTHKLTPQNLDMITHDMSLFCHSHPLPPIPLNVPIIID